MSEPTLALQVAIVAALKGQTGAGMAVFDAVRPGIFPRIGIGSGQFIRDDTSCARGFEVYFQIDVYSNAGGWTECKTITGQVYDLLHDVNLPLTGFRMTAATVSDALFTREQEESISRARMTIRAHLVKT